MADTGRWRKPPDLLSPFFVGANGLNGIGCRGTLCLNLCLSQLTLIRPCKPAPFAITGKALRIMLSPPHKNKTNLRKLWFVLFYNHNYFGVVLQF